MRWDRVTLAAMGLIAVAGLSKSAEAGEPHGSAAYWNPVQPNATNAPHSRARRDAVTSIAQISPRAMIREPRAINARAAWNYRLTCRKKPKAEYCAVRMQPVGLAEALINAPDEATIIVLDSVAFPVIKNVPPVAYLHMFHRRAKFFTRMGTGNGSFKSAPILFSSPSCGVVCQQFFAGAIQGRNGFGPSAVSAIQSGAIAGQLGAKQR